MASYNRVLLMGNLTRDIELKQLPGGQTVAEFGLAMNRKFKTKDGDTKEEVTFVDCEAWGRTAEVMKQYLNKGRGVFIEGRLRLDQWEDKDGGKRSRLRVVVETFQFVGGREGGGTGGSQGDAGSSYATAPAGTLRSEPERVSVPSGHEHNPVGEEEIPF